VEHPRVDIIVKIGGGLFRHADDFGRVLDLVGASRERRVAIVPGGGAFADTVREAYARVHLSETAAHWMAVLAMDQYAHLLADRMRNSTLVSIPSELDPVLQSGRVPIVAPFAWLRKTDALPHGWHVTSDSIAAWIAGQVCATRLVLVKPPRAEGDALLDSYFTLALPRTVEAVIVPADQLSALTDALDR
jgi:aspartokinase-like uncharacterized kinase